MEGDERRHEGPAGGRRAGAWLALGLLTLLLGWGCVVRSTAGDRRVAVYRDTAGVPALDAVAAMEPAAASPGEETGPATAADSGAADTVRVLAWNIAHNRGDLMQGNLQNFRGGGPEARNARLAGIAEVILEADADIVVLNEVDFDAAWSGGLNQAQVLAWAAGYPTRVEQRNYDYSVLFSDFAFGNAVLTRLPVRSVRHVPIPPHSELEAAVIGAKTASAVELDTRAGPIAVVPIHLEFRSRETRLAAVDPLTALQDDAPPLILAGDFNASPPGWPGAAAPTAVGRLMDAGWSSPRAAGASGEAEWTFPSPKPRRAIDWILAEPPLRVLHARVLHGAAPLSDHLPVLAVVEVKPGDNHQRPSRKP